MEKVVPGQPTLRTRADYEAATEQCLAKMARLHEEIRQEQVEIDRLKAETRAILASIKAEGAGQEPGSPAAMLPKRSTGGWAPRAVNDPPVRLERAVNDP